MKKRKKSLLYGFAITPILLLGIGLYYYVPAIPIEALNLKYGVEPEDYLDVGGQLVHYRIDGLASDSLPLVLLHGTSSSLYTWNVWDSLLQEKHKVIRLDLPGFGLTGPQINGDYRVETYLKFLDLFLAKIGVDKCILAGNSLGGEIAWRYALHNPRRVKKLVLIGAAGYPVEEETLPLFKLPLSYLWLRVPLIRDISVNYMTPEVTYNSLAYLYGKPERLTGQWVELYFDMANREGNREALTERMESFSRPSPYKKIPEIQVPTLILWGKEDNLIPVENAYKFHKNLPNSTLQIFPGAGHMPQEEIPKESFVTAIKFID